MRLGFISPLVALILSGQKTVTWRANNDRDIRAGNIIECVEADSREEAEIKEPFCKIRVISVKETVFEKLTPEDRKGHETFESEEEMYAHYSKVYNRKITEKTPLTIIKFELVSDS